MLTHIYIDFISAFYRQFHYKNLVNCGSPSSATDWMPNFPFEQCLVISEKNRLVQYFLCSVCRSIRAVFGMIIGVVWTNKIEVLSFDGIKLVLTLVWQRHTGKFIIDFWTSGRLYRSFSNISFTIPSDTKGKDDFHPCCGISAPHFQ